MIHIDQYIRDLISKLQGEFGARLLYVGLQGSHLRGEATDSSDIDIMVVLDQIFVSDLASYRTVIQTLPYADRSCGFICGKADLENWNSLEICNLLHSTMDYLGKLSTLVPEYSRADVRSFAMLSLNNLYHEICHRFIHAGTDRSRELLPMTYKGTFFILQNLHYLRSGNFVATKAALLMQLTGKDHAVLEQAMRMQSGEEFDFEESFELLLTWCQDSMQTLK